MPRFISNQDNLYGVDEADFTLNEDGEALELETGDGYLMWPSWSGVLDGGLLPGEWDDYMTRDVNKIRRRIRR